MKLKLIFLGLAAIALFGCTKASISPLNNLYDAPVEMALTKGEIKSQSQEKGYKKTVISFENGTGDNLVLSLAYKSFLFKDAAFDANTSTDAVMKGTYIPSESTANGRNIIYGTLNFSFDAATGEYSLTGIADTGEKKYKVSWTGRLTFLLEDKPVAFTKVLSGYFNPQNKAINLVLATDGISLEFNPDWNAVFYTGEGNYASIDLYSEDGIMTTASYKPSTLPEVTDIDALTTGKIVTNKGEYSSGYLIDVSAWGMGLQNWGSNLFTLAGGATEVEHIKDGNINVIQKGETWSIELKTDEMWFTYEGELPAAICPAPEPEEKAYEVSETVTPVSEILAYHQFYVMDGDKLAAVFEFTTPAGQEVKAGEYVSTENAIQNNTANVLCDGYYLDFTAMGGPIFEGGSKVANPLATATGGFDYIGAGQTVTVSYMSTRTIQFQWGEKAFTCNFKPVE